MKPIRISHGMSCQVNVNVASGVFMAPVWSLLNVNVNLVGYHIDPSIRRASTFYRAMSAEKRGPFLEDHPT